MKPTTPRRSIHRAAASLALFAALSAGARAQDEEGAPDAETETWTTLYRNYGFTDLVNSKLTHEASNLACADVDGDGRNDLVAVDNGKSRIEFLLQPGAQGIDTPDVPAGESINELPDEVRYRRESYPTEEQVSAIAIGDVNGDGRNDLLFLGDSNKLSVALRDAEGKFAPPRRYPVRNPSPSSLAIRLGDLNGDERTDVVVLGRDATYLFFQEAGDEGGEGRFAAPVELANATKDPSGMYVADLDGDDALDLLYVHFGSDLPFRHRRGQGDGTFGSEIASRFAEIRALSVADTDGDARPEIAAVRRRSGRVSLLRFEEAKVEEGALSLSALRLVPFPTTEGSDKRGAVLADVDKDGKPELVVAEPAKTQVDVHANLLGGGSAGATSFESLKNVTAPRTGDLDGDGTLEVVVASTDEGAIGIASVAATESGIELPFPTLHAIPGGRELLATNVADTNGDGAAEVWLVLGDGKGRARKWALHRLAYGPSEMLEVELKDLKGDPNDMCQVDVNRDGRNDVVLFVPREVPQILLATEQPHVFTDAKAADLPGLGILKGVTRGAVTSGDVDGDGETELLVPGSNFARAFFLDDAGQPQVVGQYSLASPSARVSAVGLADLDGDGKVEVLVVEQTGPRLVALRAGEDGGTEEVASVDLGDLKPDQVLAGDFDGNGTTDVLLLGKERFGLVQNGGADALYRVAADFELPIKDAYVFDVTLGDVNSDGEADLVMTETTKHLIAIAAVHHDAIEYALKFHVFEERIFERGGRGRPEPRELVIGDVTGDRLQDIAILIHDRVIVYPQEPAP